MSIDVDLAGALGRAAAAHHPDPPDLAALREGGRRRARRRTAARAGAGIAALVAITLGVAPLVAGGDGASEPEPITPGLGGLPFGDPPAIPYCPGDGTVVSGETTVDVPCAEMVHRGGSTLFLGDERGVVQLRDGADPVLLDRSEPGNWFPALSNDGRWAAWITSDERRPELVVVDLLQSEVVDRVPWESGFAWAPGIDDLGRVYTIDLGTAVIQLYDIATREVHEVTGVPLHGGTDVRFVTEDGFAVHQDPYGPIVVGRVDGEGRFEAQGETTWDWAHWSPDRSRVVHESLTGLLVSPARGDGPDVRLRLPSVGGPTWVPVWEDADHVLVQLDPLAPDDGLLVTEVAESRTPARRTWLLRCSADTGDCEIALDPGWGDGLNRVAYR